LAIGYWLLAFSNLLPPQVFQLFLTQRAQRAQRFTLRTPIKGISLTHLPIAH